MNTSITLWTLGRGHRHWLRALLDSLTVRFGASPVPVPVRVRSLGTRAMIALLALTLGVVSNASAQSYEHDRGRGNAYGHGSSNGWQGRSVVDGQLVDVQLLVRGEPAPLYVRSGRWDRWYFEAFKGREYAIRVRNNSGERVGVLISVDGLNVVNGERSSLANHEPMYVLDPWESATIRGWRTSVHDVRKFVFVDEHRSYAERTNQANGDMGWIRVMAFREWRPVARYKNGYEYRQDGGAPAPQMGDLRSEGSRDMARMAPEESNPGTGWGEKRYDPVRRVWFQAEHSAIDRLVFRYEYASGLQALGIYPKRFRDRIWERERGDVGFAQPPRW